MDQKCLKLLIWLASEGSLRRPRALVLAAGSIPASPYSQILDKDDDSLSKSQDIPIVLRLPISFR